jgi:hypothetical protein
VTSAHADDEAHAEETHSEPSPEELEAQHHDGATHMDAHTSISDHGHAGMALGPIDWGAWLYAVVGAASALVVVILFWVAIS